MKKLLKTLLIILVLSLSLVVVACGNNNSGNEGSNNQNNQSGSNTDDTNDQNDENNNSNENNSGEDNRGDENPSGNTQKYKLEFKEKELSAGIGEKIALEIETDIPDPSKINYKNSDNKVASFQADGSLKGLKAGTITITATYEDLEAVVTVTITEEVKVYEKTDYRYWTNILKVKYDVYAPLMTNEQIAQFNQAVYSDYSKSKVYDLTKLPLEISGQSLKNMINVYSNMNSNPVFKTKTTQASSAEKTEILNNKNLDEIKTTVNATYGVIVNFATMRSYPTLYVSVKGGTQDQFEFDRFQETALTVGETVLIYHYSKDNKWCFVQGENYFGWIQTDDVAKCTKEEFMQYYRSDKYMLCIAERMEIDGTVLRMGDKVPYKSLDDKGFIALMPKKCNDETLCITETLVPNDEKVNDGYMTYNYNNMFELGFKLLDTAYRWGDYMIDGRDCSSTQNAIYHCFGFVMPRNTSNQNKIPGYSTVVSGLTDTSMKKYAIGTLIFTSSHVMMYIGEDESGTPYLLHNSGYCKLQSLQSYGGSRMIATLTIMPK